MATETLPHVVSIPQSVPAKQMKALLAAKTHNRAKRMR